MADPPKSTDRAARQARELRANLARRKAQSRARSGGHPQPSDSAAPRPGGRDDGTAD